MCISRTRHCPVCQMASLWLLEWLWMSICPTKFTTWTVSKMTLPRDLIHLSIIYSTSYQQLKCLSCISQPICYCPYPLVGQLFSTTKTWDFTEKSFYPFIINETILLCWTDGLHAEHWYSFFTSNLFHCGWHIWIIMTLLNKGCHYHKARIIEHNTKGYRYQLVERMKCKSVTLRPSMTHNRKTKTSWNNHT